MLTRQGKHGNHFHFADDIPSHVIVSGTLPFVRLPNFKAKKERRNPPHHRAIGNRGLGAWGKGGGSNCPYRIWATALEYSVGSAQLFTRRLRDQQ